MINASARWVPHPERRMIVAALAVLMVAGLGVTALLRNGAGDRVDTVKSNTARAPGMAAEPPAQEIVEAVKALGSTQQQAVDQLQIVQDLLASQRQEIVRLSDEVASLKSKVQVLQETVANPPAATAVAPAGSAKASNKSHP